MFTVLFLVMSFNFASCKRSSGTCNFCCWP